MGNSIKGVVIAALIAMSVAGGVATAASDQTPADKGNGYSVCDEQYLKLYNEFAKKFSIQDAGRNLVEYGVLGKDGKVDPLTDERCQQEVAQFQAALNPPAPPQPQPQAVSAPVAPSAPAPTTTAAGGCPASMAGEASSPTAVNPESGAAGCFQVIPSTRDAMGAACSDINSITCEQAICAAQGNGAWDAANPC
jgi:hypothetical protein